MEQPSYIVLLREKEENQNEQYVSRLLEITYGKELDCMDCPNDTSGVSGFGVFVSFLGFLLVCFVPGVIIGSLCKERIKRLFSRKKKEEKTEEEKEKEKYESFSDNS